MEIGAKVEVMKQEDMCRDRFTQSQQKDDFQTEIWCADYVVALDYSTLQHETFIRCNVKDFYASTWSIHD